MDASGKSVAVLEGAAERETRKIRTLEEKLSIVAETMRPGASIAAIARRHGVNANLVFGWRRLHRKGLLIAQRNVRAPPLLPVTLTSPTITPTRRMRTKPSAPKASSVAGLVRGYLELVLPSGICVRVHGAVEREALETVLTVLGAR